jgi:DNA-binding HxlR family transcriptional regulator
MFHPLYVVVERSNEAKKRLELVALSECRGYSQMRENLPGISEKMLSQQLKEPGGAYLRRNGIDYVKDQHLYK